MPNTEDFLMAYGLEKGINFGKYFITGIKSSKKTIKLFREYQFDIEIKFEPIIATDNNSLLNAVFREISQERIINGKRKKFLCVIDNPILSKVTEDKYGAITFFLVGHAKRI